MLTAEYKHFHVTSVIAGAIFYSNVSVMLLKQLLSVNFQRLF